MERKIRFFSTLSVRINEFTISKIENEIKTLQEQFIEDHDAGKQLIKELERIKQIASNCKTHEFVIRIGGNSGW